MTKFPAKWFSFLGLFFLHSLAYCQSDLFIPQEFEKVVLDRIDIKYLPGSILTQVKPIERKGVVQAVERLLHEDRIQVKDLTEVDIKNIRQLMMNGEEWVSDKQMIIRRPSLLKHFYKSPSTLYQYEDKDFFFHINPVFGYQQSLEKNNRNLFINSRGINVRGIIRNKIGFQFYITENQEVSPAFAYDWMLRNFAIPGVPTFKDFKGKGVDYFDSRASINFNVSKSVSVHTGFDRMAIGSGFRSLILSEQGSSALFLKVNAKYKRLNYFSLLMELLPVHLTSTTGVYPRNYLKLNYLNYEFSKSINVALFHTTVYGTKDRFHPLYLLPVLNLHPGGSRRIDKDLTGLDFKANLIKKLQVYGQLVLDDVLQKPIVDLNKRFAFQLGIKYPDLFKVHNLDVQVELNRIAPFTYSSSDSVSNYTHANQSLAHPLGANLNEIVAIVRYQPVYKLTFRTLASIYYQGLDTLGVNFGGNIFKSNTSGVRSVPHKIGAGNKQHVVNVSFLTSYQLIPNLFVDGNLQYRHVNNDAGWKDSTVVYSIGIRYNFSRREYIF